MINIDLKSALLKLASDESKKREELREHFNLNPKFEWIDWGDEESQIFVIQNLETIEGIPECANKVKDEGLVMWYKAEFRHHHTRATRDEPADFWSDLEIAEVGISTYDNESLTKEETEELEKFFTLEKLNSLNGKFMSTLEEDAERRSAELYMDL